jgi:Xaa-Pro dipeptidase
MSPILPALSPRGTLSDQLNQAYDLVLAANAAARAAAKPGMTAKDLDEIARRVIRDGGFGPQFSHRLGHGLGLEVHEEPYIVASNDQILKPGHAFTIEPGHRISRALAASGWRMT